jgi:hypothetical protein
MSAMGLRYGIPPGVEAEIWARDVCCVYCGKAMDPKSPNRANHPSIEHLNHLPTAQYVYVKTAAYFAIACFGCNASRRDKPLARWLNMKGYADTAAPVVQDYAKRPEASLEIDPAALAQDRRNAKAKELQPAVGWSSKCRGAHGIAAKPRSVKAGSDPGLFRLRGYPLCRLNGWR